ncbi:MAG: hypothetical protein KDA91_09520 [Planctomycetaceae bacterium]|nr:hypothetical protein [Planctomycetaceae bacterium]
MRLSAIRMLLVVAVCSVVVGCGGGTGAPEPASNPTAPPTDLKAANGGDSSNMAQTPPD